MNKWCWTDWTSTGKKKTDVVLNLVSPTNRITDLSVKHKSIKVLEENDAGLGFGPELSARPPHHETRVTLAHKHRSAENPPRQTRRERQTGRATCEPRTWHRAPPTRAQRSPNTHEGKTHTGGRKRAQARADISRKSG